MVRSIGLAVIAVALVGTVGCRSKSPPSKEQTAELRMSEQRVDEAALMTTSDAWARAVKAGNVDSILSYWSDDAVVMEPDRPAISGRDTLRKMVEGSRKDPHFSITWEPERVVVAQSGDLGYLIEHNTVTFADPQGKVRTAHGKVVTVWKKDANGKWKCIVDIWNRNPTKRVFYADSVPPVDTTR